MKVNTVYLSAEQIAALAKLAAKHPEHHVSVMQEDMLTGQERYRGHLDVSVGFPVVERVHLDNDGREVTT